MNNFIHFFVCFTLMALGTFYGYDFGGFWGAVAGSVLGLVAGCVLWKANSAKSEKAG